MIFVTAATEPTVFVMLSERDVQSMREGRTVFVDERATKGAVFGKVVVSLAGSDQANLELLRRAGHDVGRLATHERLPSEARCAGCRGLMAESLLLEGRCICCHAAAAKQAHSDLGAFVADVEKLRAAQRLPSVQRTFWSGADKEQVEGLERKIDAELARRRGAGEGVDDEAG